MNEQALKFHRFLVQKSSKNRWKIKHVLIKIWTLFFDPNFVRFWTPLGTILGAWGDHFGHIWPPKSATHRGKNRCWSLLDSFLVPLRGQDQILLNFWTHLGGPSGSKMGPRDEFWACLGAKFAPKWVPVAHVWLYILHTSPIHMLDQKSFSFAEIWNPKMTNEVLKQ